MVNINDETVKKIAKLSRIDVKPSETDAISQKLTHIMGWIEQLNTVNIDNIEPMTCVLPMPLKMRHDVVTDGGYPDIIVKNSPVKDGHFFCVPKVVE